VTDPAGFSFYQKKSEPFWEG